MSGSDRPVAHRRRSRFVAAGLVVGALLSAVPVAHATVIERVVAVIGEKALLLSDLQQRARPFLVRVMDEVPPGAQRAAAISQMHKMLLERMVDEELEQRAANRAHIVVTAREVDDAVARVAEQNNMSVEQVVGEAIRSGLTERDYRTEIRRQVLEAKLLNLRIQGRIRVTEQDLRQAYRRIVVDERKKLAFRPAWIKIDAPRGDGADAVTARRKADHVADLARRGADFAELARNYSDDAATRAMGGLLRRVKPGKLPAELDRVALGLEVGEVSPPVRVGDSLVILKIVEREESQLPTYADARSELGERVYLDKMNRARRVWLDGLRKQTHVEIRL